MAQTPSRERQGSEPVRRHRVCDRQYRLTTVVREVTASLNPQASDYLTSHHGRRLDRLTTGRVVTLISRGNRGG